MVSWKEYKLRRENKKLKKKLKDSLELIEDLSNLKAPLLEAELTLSFKMKYVRTVSSIKKILKGSNEY